MPLACTFEEAARRAREVDVLGERYLLREYVGNAPVRGIYVEGSEAHDNRAPQGFLVRQPPGSVTRPHFHETHQFQVFVGGGGRFGKKPVRPVTVQFAAGHTPYGPIVAGAQGVEYFTLRQRWDPGAKYMPRMREKLVRGHQRQALATGIELEPPGARAGRAGVDVELLMPPAPDGFLAQIVRAPAGAPIKGPEPASGGGQYHLVLAGALEWDGRPWERLACLWLYPEDPLLRGRAGPEGLELLTLQFGTTPPPRSGPPG